MSIARYKRGALIAASWELLTVALQLQEAPFVFVKVLFSVVNANPLLSILSICKVSYSKSAPPGA